MTLLSDHSDEIQFQETVGTKPVGNQNNSVGVSEQTAGNAEQKLSTPLAYVEGLDDLPIRVCRLPLGPTEAHIEGMISAGLLTKENLFVGEDRCEEFSENASVPQAMGYKISEFVRERKTNPVVKLVERIIKGRKINPVIEFAERIITDKETLGQVLTAIGEGKYITMYVGNHEFNEAWTRYLGKRRPTYEEQVAIWNKLPGGNVLEKATGAGIPFPGHFRADDGRFHGCSHWIYLTSSDLCKSGFESLFLEHDDQDVRAPRWRRPRHGCSTLVVEDRK